MIFAPSKILTFFQDNQVVVSVQVFEGERSVTKHNDLLGGFELTGIPPAPRAC
jgi:molecular chaperone DnaK (HSP70)